MIYNIYIYTFGFRNLQDVDKSVIYISYNRVKPQKNIVHFNKQIVI